MRLMGEQRKNKGSNDYSGGVIYIPGNSICFFLGMYMWMVNNLPSFFLRFNLLAFYLSVFYQYLIFLVALFIVFAIIKDRKEFLQYSKNILMILWIVSIYQYSYVRIQYYYPGCKAALMELLR